MDTFIVRFYRRERCSPQDVAGVVEHVGSGERSGFSGERQLLDRLLKPRHDSARASIPATDSQCGKHADE